MATAAPQTRTRKPKPALGTVAKRRRDATESALRALRPKGNTVLMDFGRVLRDEPHKYIYPIKLYMKDGAVPIDRVLEWLRERYICSKGGRNHGARYEVRKYTTANGVFVDYILLEKMTDDERVLFTLEFGDVTDEKIVRDGKLRRPRLKKEEKAVLDDMINNYYLDVAKKRREEAEELAERRAAEAA
jgi:hypothetical protein